MNAVERDQPNAQSTATEGLIGLTGIRLGLHASKVRLAVALWCNG